MKIAVFGKETINDSCREVTRMVFDSLLQHNIEICVEKNFYTQLLRDTTFDVPADSLIFCNSCEADMALSIGGDGTFLRTASFIGETNIPILGINTGRLGFLTDLSGNDIEKELHEILQGNYCIERRSLLQVVADGIEDLWPYALNDVSLLKQDSASMISIHTTINNEYFNRYRADGLIIATPTGSTAYSLSVGGPVLVPQAANWVISPVAPHSFTVRPLVVNDDVTISLQVSSRTGNFLLSCDGRSLLLKTDSTVILKKAPFTIKVVKGSKHTFSETLRKKLMWGADIRD